MLAAAWSWIYRKAVSLIIAKVFYLFVDQITAVFEAYWQSIKDKKNVDKYNNSKDRKEKAENGEDLLNGN